MMYKHKNLKQLLCCVLLLCLFCGSSLGFFSVKADTVIQSNRDVSQYFDLGNNVRCLVAVSSLAPFAEVYSYEDEYHSGTENEQNLTGVCQYYVFSVYLQNKGEHTIQTNSWFFKLNAQTPALTSDFKIGYSVEFLNGDVGSIEIGTSGDIWCYPSGNIQTNDYKITIPANRSISFQFVVAKHVSRLSANAIMTSVNSFDTPVSSVSLVAPASCTINDDIVIYDDNYNSALSLQQLKDIQAQLVLIYTQMSQNIASDNSQIIAGQEETNSNITAQTEQQKEQYDAFSANTDSSDSNNINSAITGGTDAVKEKMGLFSFFDGIVSDLSDVLTKNHERHLVLPALDVPLPEETVHIWDRKEFDFEELENNFGAILTVVRFATVAVCYVTMINGAYHLFHKFIGVKDSDA